MLRSLPARMSSRWFYIAIVYLIVLWGALLINRQIVLTGSLDIMLSLRLLLLSTILSAVINASGWLGARRIWLCSTIGVAIGVVSMFIYASSSHQTGWEDLLSLLAFITCSGFGIGAGIITEAAVALYRLMRRSR